MIRPTHIKDYGSRHGGKTEEWIGEEGKRCLECALADPKDSMLNGGAVLCKPDNKTTWGGALCARFVLDSKRSRKLATPVRGFGK